MRRSARVPLLLLLLLSVLPSASARAQDEGPDVVTPVELALVSPIHIVHGDRKLVVGLGINLLYGQGWRHYGVELGVVNHDRDAQVGLQAGAVNVAEGDQVGLQAGAVNVVVRGAAHGLNVGGLWTHLGEGCRGICVGGFGTSSNHPVIPLTGRYGGAGDGEGGGIVVGGLFNFLGGHFYGLLVTGGSNFSAYGGGLQIGLVNDALLGFGGVQISVFGNLNGAILIDSEDHGSYVIETRQSFTRSWADGVLLSAFVNSAQNSRALMISAGLNLIAVQGEGVQIGVVNVTNSGRLGHPFTVQLGATNIAGDMAGVQVGAVNVAATWTGCRSAPSTWPGRSTGSRSERSTSPTGAPSPSSWA